MIGHIILTVSDIDTSLAFYAAAPAPFNIKFFVPFKSVDGHPDLWGFGDGQRAHFWLKQGKPSPDAIHWGFAAASNAVVDTFYAAAMTAGATDNIPPRPAGILPWPLRRRRARSGRLLVRSRLQKLSGRG